MANYQRNTPTEEMVQMDHHPNAHYHNPKKMTQNGPANAYYRIDSTKIVPRHNNGFAPFHNSFSNSADLRALIRQHDEISRSTNSNIGHCSFSPTKIPFLTMERGEEEQSHQFRNVRDSGRMSVPVRLLANSVRTQNGRPRDQAIDRVIDHQMPRGPAVSHHPDPGSSSASTSVSFSAHPISIRYAREEKDGDGGQLPADPLWWQSGGRSGDRREGKDSDRTGQQLTGVPIVRFWSPIRRRETTTMPEGPPRKAEDPPVGGGGRGRTFHQTFEVYRSDQQKEPRREGSGAKEIDELGRMREKKEESEEREKREEYNPSTTMGPKSRSGASSMVSRSQSPTDRNRRSTSNDRQTRRIRRSPQRANVEKEVANKMGDLANPRGDRRGSAPSAAPTHSIPSISGTTGHHHPASGGNKHPQGRATVAAEIQGADKLLRNNEAARNGEQAHWQQEQEQPLYRPLIKRTRTVPAINFHFDHPQETQRPRSPLIGAKQQQPRRSGELLCPSTKTRNLLQEAISSLEGNNSPERPSKGEKRQQNNNPRQIAQDASTTIPNNNQNNIYPEQFLRNPILERVKVSRPAKIDHSLSDQPRGYKSPDLQEELLKLFEELGFLDQLSAKEMTRTTHDWRNSFAAMKEHFGRSVDERQQRRVGEQTQQSQQERRVWERVHQPQRRVEEKTQQSQPQQSQQERRVGDRVQQSPLPQSPMQQPALFSFSTNGAQQRERRQNACTTPRTSASRGNNASLVRRSASSNSLYNIGDPGSFSPSSSSTSTESARQFRRPSLPQQQFQQQKVGGSRGDLSNFWLTMVKARTEASSPSQAQRLSQGLNAAERLQNVQHQQQLYPYRRIGGVIETVAMRRNNYLLEAARTSSGSPSGRSTPTSMDGFSTTTSGRITPTFRFKSPSPSRADTPPSHLDLLDFGTPAKESASVLSPNRKGCGRFPTVSEEDVEQLQTADRLSPRNDGRPQQKTVPPKRKSRSPDTLSECSSQQSQSSAKPATLPQPMPRHNLRDQLLSVGVVPVGRHSASGSFFGGSANNPWQKRMEEQQRQRQQQSSPNFPATNTVTSRVSQFENKQQQQQQSGLGMGSPSSSPSSQQSRPKPQLVAQQPQHLNIVNGPSGTNGQLSPRSSVFRTKSVIVFDFDHLEEKEPSKNKEERTKLAKTKRKQKEPKGKVQPMTDKTVANNKHNDVAATVSGGDKSPRWCGDPNEMAMGKHGRQQWERPRGPESPLLPFTSSGPTQNGWAKGGRAKEPDQHQQTQAQTSNKVPEEVKSAKIAPQPHRPQLQQQQNSANALQQPQHPPPQLIHRPQKSQMGLPDPYSPSVVTVQHQLINGSLPQLMVVSSTKVPPAQFISASVSAVVSGAFSAEALIPSGNSEDMVEAKVKEEAEEKRKRDAEAEERRKNREAEAAKRSRIAGKLAGTPRFHFPLGRPISQADNDLTLGRIRELFESRPRAQLHLDDFGELCRRMHFAIYAKRPVYDVCCHCNGLPILPPLALGTVSADESEVNGQGAPIDFNQFCVYWNRMVSEAHDEASRFVFTLSAMRHSSQQQRHILREDFVPMLMDLILTHPGLHFLKEAPQFYSRYADVVIVRIFWNVNRSWSGRISAAELKRSNFLQTLHMLDDVQDINKVTDYFSYEHFYVTYCKFWELDTDHDMIISRDDMRRHCNGALPDRIIERIFSAAVIRTPPDQRTVSLPAGPIRQQPIETIGFEDFVCFLLAEEDKRHPTSIEYWFRCVDLDGDGQISLYEMEYFYEAIEQKLLAKNMETLALRDVICNLLDSIAPSNGHSVTRADLKRSGLAHRFFNTFVNWIKYVDQESSDGERASVKTNEDKELSDWEMFCLSEYELLMSETEQLSNEGDVDENIDVNLDDDEEEGGGGADTHIAVTIGEEERRKTDQQQQQQMLIGNGTVVGGEGGGFLQQRQQIAKVVM